MANKGGQPGNQNAAKGRRLSDFLVARLEQKDACKKIAEKLTEKAVEGDLPAIREIFDRTEGKAQQTTVLAGDPENPIGITTSLSGETSGLLEEMSKGSGDSGS